jgi:WD40 repeat protein
MRPRPFLLLIVGVALALMAAGEAEAGIEPLWNYNTDFYVDSVAISADGKYIVAGSAEDYKVHLFDKGRVWDNSNTPLWSYDTGGYVGSLAISADGEYIVIGSDKVYLFDKDSSTPLWNYSTGARVNSVAISADGEYIAVGSWDDNVYLFDKDSSTPLWNYTTDFYVDSVAISADGKYIVAGSAEDYKVHLFDKDSSTPLWSYSTGDWVRSLAISADGEYIVIGSDKVHLFDKDSSSPLWSYETGSAVWSVAISADGKYIAAGSSDNNVYLFDKDSSTPLWNYPLGSNVLSVAISADGGYIAAGSYPSVYLFDKDSSTPLWSSNIVGYVRSVVISADGEYIATGSDEVCFFLNNLPPTATIDSIFPSPARFDAEVTFSGTGSDRDGTVVAYEWNGVLSDEEDFSISGLSVGYHSINFRVMDNDGSWSVWSTAVLHVYPNAPPDGTLNFIEPSPAEEGTAVFFNGTGSDDNGTITYLWESSIDGVIGTEDDFSSSNLSLGTHTITFRVQDNDGAWSDVTLASLFVGIAPIPKAGMDVEVKSNMEVQFIGSGTDEDGTIVNYEWDLNGDGVYDWSSTLNGITTNSYNSEGTYTAVLRLTDDDGLTATDSRVITVSKAGGGGAGGDDGGDGGGGIPAPSLAASVAAVAVIALRRPGKA